MKANLFTTLTLIVSLAAPAFAAAAATSSSKSRSGSSASQSKANSVEKMPAAQSAAKKLADDLTSTQESKLLTFLNEAEVKSLAEIKGISTRRGSSIEKARPFKSVDEVVLISGIGEGTFSELVKYGKTLTRSRSTSSSSKSSSSKSKS